MKKFVLVSVLILSFQFSFGQILKIKKQLKECLFETERPITKFDLRKLLNTSNNFSDIHEYTYDKYDVISYDFETNYKLSYTKDCTHKQSSVWYIKGTDEEFAFGYELYFPSENFESASNQLTELVNFFKPISFKVSDEHSDLLSRNRSFTAYSTKSKYDNTKFYSIIDLKYRKVEGKEGENMVPAPGEYYVVSFTYYNGNL